MRRVLPLVLALALAACTSGTPKPAVHATATPTSATPAASAPPSRSLVVAVTRTDHPGVWLYHVGEQRIAKLSSTLLPPPGRFFSTYGMSLSGKGQPDLCVVWTGDEPEGDGGGEEAAYCYPQGQAKGMRLPVKGHVDEVALDASGSQVFWSTDDPEADTMAGVVAEYSAGRVTGQRPFSMDCSRYLLAAVWAGRDRLVLHCTSGDNDDPGFLVTEEVGDGSGPPHQGHRIGPDERFVWPGYADETSVLALERRCRSRCDTAAPQMLSERAVRVDVRTGRLVEVIATPAKGRFLVSVTGGAHGVVYVTDAEGEKRDVLAYLRWPGESHGTPITGLPADLDQVVGQP